MNNNNNNNIAGKYTEPNIFTHFAYETPPEQTIYDHMNQVEVIQKIKLLDSIYVQDSDDLLKKHNSIINTDKNIIDKILKDTRKFINK